jgi:hypothetical protein
MRKITHIHASTGYAMFEIAKDGNSVTLTTSDGAEESITIVIPLRDFMRSTMDINLFLWDYELQSLKKPEVVNG